MRQTKKFFIALLSCLATSAGAATPTAAQLAQFQSLPKAQQETLAKQYGFDLGNISSATTRQTSKPQEITPILQPSIARDEKDKEDEELFTSDELPLFGYDIINANGADLSLIDNVPVPLDYQMGPGDSIRVEIYGKTEQSFQLKIDRNGQVNLPSIGPLPVSGQTFVQMREQIASEIKRKSIGVDVSVAMGSMRAMQVYIVGEANYPGAYNVNGLTTLIQALVASGGVNETGSLRNIQLLRKGKVIQKFDLYELLLKGSTTRDIRLSSGDTLFIPVKDGSIAIDGEVARPAVYELKENISLNEFIAMAGGVTPTAYLSRVSVKRPTSKGVRIYTLDVTKPEDRAFVVKHGDEVKVESTSSELQGAVAIRGEVVRQGPIRFKEGMRISDAIGSIEEGLKPTADLNYALLVRESNLDRRIDVFQVDLLSALTEPNSQYNLLLAEKDQLFVLDNGLDQDYWLGEYSNDKVSSSFTNRQQTTSESIDLETGAVVERSTATAINTEGAGVLTEEVGKQKASREALLQPIIDRLKEQASLGVPAKLIEISGAVRFPGVYPLAENTDLSALLKAAGGLTEQAYLPSAELNRQKSSLQRTVIELINFSLQQVLKGEASLTLKPQDHINIKHQPGWEEGMVVELQGEFVFPGTYTFRRGESLRDVIERAGGFTEYAYPQGAVFSRERLKKQEQERLKMLNNQLKQEISNLALRRQSSSSSYATDPAQAIALVDQLDNVQAVGRLVVDLQKAVEGDEISNLLLEKEDKIFVPALNPVISIVGEVQYASNHTFNPSLTVEDYIASAGGTKRQADTSRIYIVKANGSVELPNNSFWFSRNYKPLEPGDTIIVPINTDYLDGLSTVSTATQILYQIGVAWSAVKD